MSHPLHQRIKSHQNKQDHFWKFIFNLLWSQTTKKLNYFVADFVFCIKVIANSLFSVVDSISEQDYIGGVHDGLLEEYNVFDMQVYDRIEPHTMYDVEVFLYIQSRGST